MRPHNSTITISCKGTTATSQVGDTVRIKFFADTNEVNGAAHHAHPFDRRVRNIDRSMRNGRQQDGVRAEYVKSTKMRGIVENVRGEAWMQQRSSDLVNGTDSKCASFFALSFASLTEAFYTALVDDPTNENLLLTLSRGLECRISHAKTPPSICRYLVNLHNRFHCGSSTSFVELLSLVPEVSLATFSARCLWWLTEVMNWQCFDSIIPTVCHCNPPCKYICHT